MTQVRVGLGDSGLSVFPLALGGNVFGWTADQAASAAILDAYAAGGGNFIDTADSYSAWAPGNVGGESETIIGDWMSARGNRDEIIVATKAGRAAGLSATVIPAAADASLRRLKTDHIDVYYAHWDDVTVPLEETIGALSALVDAGKVRHIALSNYSPERVEEWFSITADNGFHRPVAFQPQYNLMERGFESAYGEIVARESLSVVPYYSLAHGFLTGKYRPGTSVDSVRAGSAEKYLDERGLRVLAALDAVAAAHEAEVASVALAWLAARPGVAAPIASASRAEQVGALVASATLHLSSDEMSALDAASA